MEKEAEESHEGLRPGCSAAFGVEKHNEEHLILVAEVREKNLSIKQLDDICYAVCGRVQQAHRLVIHTLVLINPRSISKTTSGKIRRRQCRTNFLNQSLDVVHKVTAPHQFGLLPTTKPTILKEEKKEETVHVATAPSAGFTVPRRITPPPKPESEADSEDVEPVVYLTGSLPQSWWRGVLGIADDLPLSTMVLAVLFAMLLAWQFKAVHV